MCGARRGGAATKERTTLTACENGEPRAEVFPFPAWAIRDVDALISARVAIWRQAREELRVVQSGKQPEGRSSPPRNAGGLRRLLEAWRPRGTRPHLLACAVVAFRQRTMARRETSPPGTKGRGAFSCRSDASKIGIQKSGQTGRSRVLYLASHAAGMLRCMKTLKKTLRPCARGEASCLQKTHVRFECARPVRITHAHVAMEVPSC
ncbi:hypothetical protein M2103_000562 [Ereboglobus sp. PH5-5]|nr:hypothetical protein [Ereboglobus sp. PH5-5]